MNPPGAATAAVKDRYPTRIGNAVPPIPRTEPAVWGGESDGPLLAHELARFEQRGYLVRPGTLTDDVVVALRGETARIATDLEPGDPRIIWEPGGSIRSIFEPHQLSELVARVVDLDTVTPVARQLLGSDVYIHQARINVMPGFTGTGFYWHSDFETWHAEDGMADIRAVSCSIALTHNYPYNGSLMVIPGSHRTFYPCIGATPDNHHGTSLVAQQVGTPEQTTLTTAVDRHGIDQFTGPPGTALWFDANLLHGSGSNITPLPRSNVFLVFNSVHNRLGEPFAAPRPRPHYLAAR